MRMCCCIMTWDEIDGVARLASTDHERNVDCGRDGMRSAEVDLAITATDEEIEAMLREMFGDDGDEPGWELMAIARGKRTITVEWASDRNHLAVNTLMWS